MYIIRIILYSSIFTLSMSTASSSIISKAFGKLLYRMQTYPFPHRWMLPKSTIYSHGNDLCSSRDATVSVYSIPMGSIVRSAPTRKWTEINQKIIISLQENKRLIRRAAMACSAAIRTRFRAEGERRGCVGRATYPTKIPTVLIFQWTVSSDGGSRVQVRGEQRENVTAELSRSLAVARNSLSAVPWSANPSAMCAELLLIKGIVERLVGKSRRGPTSQSMELRLAVWIAGAATRRGLRRRRGLNCAPLLCESWSGRLKLPVTFRWIRWWKQDGPYRRTSYANSRISISRMVTRHFADRAFEACMLCEATAML